jgi:serine/threonine protein kinase
MAAIFISYAREDTERALAVREALSRRYTVSMDCDIPVGARYREWIEQHLGECAACVVLWSRAAIRKSWVLDEAGEIHRLSKPLVPIIIDEELDGDQVPMGFRQLQYLRCQWRAKELEPRVVEALLESLDAHLKSAGPLKHGLEQLRAELVQELGVDYEVIDALGTGRLSAVYKARSKADGGVAAISVTPIAGVLLIPGFLAHFLAGVRVAQTLKHKYILEIRQLAFRGTIACTVMEYVDGRSLSTLIARGPLELKRVQHIAERLAEGLAYAHSRDVVHANLRSACILVDAHDRPVITDFVMAEMRGGPNIASTNTALLADPRYLSPEQCRGEPVGYYADQYALGVILFEMLTGVVPFAGSSPYNIMRAQVESAPPPLCSLRPGCPRSIQETVTKLLSKDPWGRFISGEELIREIRAWAVDEGLDSLLPPSRSPARAASQARASYRRCRRASPDFLTAFYANLIKNEVIRRHFYGVPVDRLAEKLGEAIELLLSLGGSDSDPKALRAERAASSQEELERVAGPHRRLELTLADLGVFVDVLVRLVLEKDPSAQGADQRALLQADWRAALAPGISQFLALCEGRPIAAPQATAADAVPDVSPTARTHRLTH